MIFYLAIDAEGNRQLAGTQADAKAINKTFEQVDIPVSKAELMAFVQQLYTEIDGSAPVVGSEQDTQQVEDAEPSEPVSPQAHDVSPTRPTYTDWSVKMDDVFPTLPLAHQLHFAAMAMENARDRLTEAPCNLASHPNGAEVMTTTG